MEEYKSNSYKSKAERPEKKVEKVIHGSAKVKKKSSARKVAEAFIAEDIGNIKDYILMDVLVPAIKKTVSDIVTEGIHAVFGDVSYTKKGSTASRVSYRSYYDKENERRGYSGRSRSGYDYDDIILPDRGEAERVLTGMDEVISRYGMISILDMYDLAGLPPRRFTDDKYGWTDIRGASVVRLPDGYTIKLPRAMPFD